MFRTRIPANFYYLLAILIVIFLLGLAGALRPARGFFERALVIPTKQKIYDWQRFLKKDLRGCQFQDERQMDELKVKIASLIEENLSQKRLLSAPLPRDWQFLPVKVIEVKDEILTLGFGAQDGVKEGMVAVFGETYLGKVSSVSEALSEIKLPSFLEEKLAVKFVSSEEEDARSFSDKTIVGEGLSVGRGQGKTRVEQVLSSEKIEKGDLVITNVQGANLLVGKVEEVVEKKGEVFKNASVKILYNPEELNTIFLVRGKL